MFDVSKVKLGKLAPIVEPGRRLLLSNYVDRLPAPPASVDWTKGITSWGMMLNDSLGCCTIAALGHAVQCWTANCGPEITVSDAAIAAYYELWDGYVPGEPSTDQGGVEIDVLNDWRQSDFAGVKLLAYADPSPLNVFHVKQAVSLFGGVYIGLALPRSAQGQALWDAVEGEDGIPGTWGGHAVYVVAYDAVGLTVVTWGALQKMTWAFWAKYCDEAHALLSNLWTPAGVDTAALLADVAAVAA